MELSVFERMELLARGAFSIFGNPKVLRKQDNLGTAMLFEEYLLRADTTSSAAAKNTKELWR